MRRHLEDHPERRAGVPDELWAATAAAQPGPSWRWVRPGLFTLLILGAMVGSGVAVPPDHPPCV
jgi:hypothetical protein